MLKMGATTGVLYPDSRRVQSGLCAVYAGQLVFLGRTLRGADVISGHPQPTTVSLSNMM